MEKGFASARWQSLVAGMVLVGVPRGRRMMLNSSYDPDGFYVPNSINRYNLAAWMPLQFNPDGSLDIYIQSNSPGAGKEANWLPAPASGPFSLTVRNYWPKESVLDGTYKVPPTKLVR